MRLVLGVAAQGIGRIGLVGSLYSPLHRGHQLLVVLPLDQSKFIKTDQRLRQFGCTHQRTGVPQWQFCSPWVISKGGIKFDGITQLMARPYLYSSELSSDW